VWTKGDSTGTDDIQRAVAALVTDQESLRSLLPSVASAAAKGDWGGFAQDTQALLLARIYLELKDTTKAKAASERLLASYPDSATALAMAGEAYRLSGDLKGWRDLLDSRLAKRPEDRALLLQRVDEAVAEGDFTAALDRCRKSLDSAHATSEDRNRCARLAVFAGKVDEEALAEAQSANLAEHKDNAAYLTTEAWINAELGNMAEARQLLLDAMDEAGLEEPSSDMWFAFGRMYEQYGVPAAAAAAYRRVKPAKKGAKEVRLDTTLLANARLKAMHMD
jgi:tetratricopeptide (TPR) repeat protein